MLIEYSLSHPDYIGWGGAVFRITRESGPWRGNISRY